MNITRLFITSFIVLSLCVGCSSTHSRKYAKHLPYTTGERAYQIKVRSGNLAMDDNIYALAFSDFSKYLPVSKRGPYVGFIEITFKSSSKTLFKDPVPGYLTNIQYGDAWFTGNINEINDKLMAKTEIKPGGVFTDQDSVMTVVIKDIKGRKIWNADDKYNSHEIFSVQGVDSADKAASSSIHKLVEFLRSDFNLKQQESVGGKTSYTPESAIIVGKRTWKELGKNQDGESVSIDINSINYKSMGRVSLYAKIFIFDRQIQEYEINCSQNKYRVLDDKLSAPASVLQKSVKWLSIPPESTSSLLYFYVCK